MVCGKRTLTKDGWLVCCKTLTNVVIDKCRNEKFMTKVSKKICKDCDVNVLNQDCVEDVA